MDPMIAGGLKSGAIVPMIIFVGAIQKVIVWVLVLEPFHFSIKGVLTEKTAIIRITCVVGIFQLPGFNNTQVNTKLLAEVFGLV